MANSIHQKAETGERAKTGEKTKEKKEPKFKKEKIIDIAAEAVAAVDEICDEAGELAGAGGSGLINVGAAVVNFYDRMSAIAEWFIKKNLVIAGRRLHEMRLRSAHNKKDLIKDAVVLGVACVAMVVTFAMCTGYQYSYNGRPLGIVKEHSDVLDILDLASEELSQEYGSNIVIDPSTT